MWVSCYFFQRSPVVWMSKIENQLMMYLTNYWQIWTLQSTKHSFSAILVVTWFVLKVPIAAKEFIKEGTSDQFLNIVIGIVIVLESTREKFCVICVSNRLLEINWQLRILTEKKHSMKTCQSFNLSAYFFLSFLAVAKLSWKLLT